MESPLRLLIVDDQLPDAELSAEQIARGGYPCTWRRVETEADFRTELREFAPDLIISDFSLPHYSGLAALELAVSEAPDVPFIFVSGTIGEKRAAEALTRGATDYVPKGDLTGLVPAVTRALSEPAASPSRGNPAERIRRLTGALQILSGIRASAAKLPKPMAFLEEACGIVFGSKQYPYAFVVLNNPNTHIAHVAAWSGAGADRGRGAKFHVAETNSEDTLDIEDIEDSDDTSVVGRVLRTGLSVVCLDIDQYRGPLSEYEHGAAQPASACVSLPLLVGERAIGALTVGAATSVHISEQELLLLEEIANQVSFSFQALSDHGTAGRLAPLDPLTGLPRREFFCEHLSALLRGDAAQDSVPTVIVFDIERLRDINDAHGRHVGDRLLQGVAERLKRRFGDDGSVAHFGGGTFVAVFGEHRRLSDPARDSATAVFGHPFMISERPVPVTVKCGLARYPAHGRDAETLLQYAEAALGRIRERNEPLPHPLLSANAIDPEQRALEQRLRHALKSEQFLVHYQPVIERASGAVVAVEALLRWRDPERGMIPPGVFLPTLEQTGLIIPVGEWVLARTVRDFAEWHGLGLPKIRVAVNVTLAELSRSDFASYFLDSVRQARATPGIDLEISESVLLEYPDDLRQTLRTLRTEGVRVAVDDFGMGSASLNRLAELPADSVKIDRSFIDHLAHEPQTQAVVAGLIDLANAYNLRTIAEGVETLAQLEILDALGCEQSQGYFHSPAVSAEELRLFVASRAAEAE